MTKLIAILVKLKIRRAMLASLFSIVFYVFSGLALASSMPILKISLISPEGKMQIYIAEIAANREDRQLGLMHRNQIADDEAMLFIWPYEGLRLFWMKNTWISLDILFFNKDGVLVHIIANAEPNSEYTISSMMPVQYAVELKAGEAMRHGFTHGTKLALPVY